MLAATTENPSFALNNALLSRARIYRLKPLEHEDLAALIDRVLADDQRGLGARALEIEPAAQEFLYRVTDGDAR